MALEVNQKLTEIMRVCAEKRIRVSFTQYGSKKNAIERTIEMGEDILLIQIGNENDSELPDLLDEWIKKL